MNPGVNFETSMVKPLCILVVMVKRQIGKGSFELGRFIGRPFVSPFIVIIFSLLLKTLKKH